MKHCYILLFLTLFLPFQVVRSEVLSLEKVIQQALQNSPEMAHILNNIADTRAEAFEIATADTPIGEIDVVAVEDDASRSMAIEFEQPVRLSIFGSRRSYADALRHTASIEEKAQMFELIHTVTREYASYWMLQEQEKLLSQNVIYAREKQKLVEVVVNEGDVDVLEAKIFKAEALRSEEQLRALRVSKTNSAANLSRLAGMDQIVFKVQQPGNPEIPDLNFIKALAGKEGSVRSLLESRKALADKHYQVAKEDARFPEFAPRALMERDFDEDSTAILFGLNITIPIWDRNNAELSRAAAQRKKAQRILNAFNGHNFANVLAIFYERAKAMQVSASIYRDKIIPVWNEVQSITDEKFKNGQASILDLFEMRERISELQSEALQTYLNSIEERIALESLIGQSLINIKK